jgi:putative salt-induced outer membrane protein
MDWMSASWLVVAMAQAGTTQAPAPPPPPPPVVEGSAELSYVGTSGNSDTQSLGVGTTLTVRPGEWTLANKASFVRNSDRGQVRAQSALIETQVGRRLAPTLSLVGKHGYYRDRFAGINHRHTVDAGLSFEAVRNTRHTLTLDAGVGYANERRRAGGTVSGAIATTGVAYRLALSTTATLSNTATGVFSLADSRDRRATNVASLSARLTTLLSMKVTHTTRWVAVPVSGFKKTDTITAVALVAKF